MKLMKKRIDGNMKIQLIKALLQLLGNGPLSCPGRSIQEDHFSRSVAQ